MTIGTGPLISVCIPAYNRASLLPALLDSILAQDFGDYEVLICEDGSPEREAIGRVVERYRQQTPVRIRYEQNAVNLGYDGNIRRLVELAQGRYCLFMGNDDLLCPGALTAVAGAVHAHPDAGVVVRSYASFDADPAQFKQVFRYFPEQFALAPGAQAIFTAYRRSVVISGMVVHRGSAAAQATARFDGTLLYQLYLVGMVLANRSVVFMPQIIALRRDGTPPDFGHSEAERGKFVPHDQTPESSVHFMRGMLNIAAYVELATSLDVVASIRADIGNYAYPILAIQARRPLPQFLRYGLQLAQLGLWRYPLFHLYFIALVAIGPDRSDRLIKAIKQRVGHTPRFGSVRDKTR